jgi:hypothetical protein
MLQTSRNTLNPLRLTHRAQPRSLEAKVGHYQPVANLDDTNYCVIENVKPPFGVFFYAMPQMRLCG